MRAIFLALKLINPLDATLIPFHDDLAGISNPGIAAGHANGLKQAD